MRTFHSGVIRVDINLDPAEYFRARGGAQPDAQIEVHGLSVRPGIFTSEPDVQVGGLGVRKDGTVGTRWRTNVDIAWSDVPVAIRNAVRDEYRNAVSEIPTSIEEN